MRSAPPLVALALATTLLLSGCVPQAPDINPPPELTTEPVFASDEEALAAATDAYKAYLAMSDLISQEGGKDPERIAPFVTEEWLATEVEAFVELSETRHRQAGNIRISNSELQSSALAPDGSPNVGAYFCLDFTSVDLISQDGATITPDSRAAVMTVEVQFVGGESRPDLKVERIEPWPSAGIC